MSAAHPAPPSRQALAAEISRRLDAAGLADPAREAQLILRWASGLSPRAFAAARRDPPGPVERARAARALAARLDRRPFSHVTGRRAFWGRDFCTGPEVLDPRPETETLVAAALEARFARLLDLGTGSGCLLLTLLAERPGTTGLGTDTSGPALRMAQRNARRLGLEARAVFARADWVDGLPPGTWDLVVSNPPYIAAHEIPGLAPEVARHEPRAALTPDSGPAGDGLGAYRRIAASLPETLAPGGRAILELGRGQAAAVAGIIEATGLAVAGLRRDLDGNERAIIAVHGKKTPKSTLSG
ncbi:peptide chain release factor N(5)-glutamine methyltransferase [Paralimibaculum aggregatum]|uniref:Release factor glutamine methyltransferase n=1 Tax=Paralimibaculum aggregatum TaxID=3036245 RepID=A0ABQ6LG64_9RHOB|nr:peptide chain release factor N(5)-glutamine methyltransferase [Limibaculum sp. NKW23]GMG82307.1 peptide chain release factor N(5)-glutamine methyltransferase [Limibaculum sp. NKW23]